MPLADIGQGAAMVSLVRGLARCRDHAARGLAVSAVVATVLATPGKAHAASDSTWAGPIMRHVAEAVVQQPRTLEQWEAAKWSPGREGNPAWVNDPDPGVRAQVIAAYQQAYEDTYGPLRAVAARRFSKAIAGTFSLDTGVEPPAATAICQQRTAPGPARLGNLFGDPPDLAAERAQWEAMSAQSSMTAGHAAEVIAITCRLYHQATITSRVALATKAAKVGDVFGNEDQLAVPAHADGQLIELDPMALVSGAAADGIQVVFHPGGWFDRTPTMTVTPFGHSTPKLEAKVVKRTNADGTVAYVVTGLGSIPGLRTPEATLDCLATSVAEYGRKAHAALVGNALDVLFGGSGRNLGETRRQAEEFFAGCAAAKAAFAKSGSR